jgi:Mrp family chromosome partitioning ATPase
MAPRRAVYPGGENAEQAAPPSEVEPPSLLPDSKAELDTVGSAQGRQPVPPEVLESCAAALAGMGGPAARSIAVTSCHRGEGRSTVALALALLERKAYDRRTLLVELDLERPCLTDVLGLPHGPGVVDVLRGETTVEGALRWTDDDLAVLVAGDPRGEPAALFARVVTGDLLDVLSGLFDTLVIDLPPLEGTGTAALVARQSSSPVLVVRAGAAELRDIKKAVAMFHVPPPILMNGVSPRRAQTARRRPG